MPLNIEGIYLNIMLSGNLVLSNWKSGANNPASRQSRAIKYVVVAITFLVLFFFFSFAELSTCC